MTGDKLASQEYVRKLNELPVLKSAAMKFLERPDLHAIRAKAEPALLASVAEFILEGLHVQNRLNKSAKAGENVYKR